MPKIKFQHIIYVILLDQWQLSINKTYSTSKFIDNKLANITNSSHKMDKLINGSFQLENTLAILGLSSES